MSSETNLFSPDKLLSKFPSLQRLAHRLMVQKSSGRSRSKTSHELIEEPPRRRSQTGPSSSRTDQHPLPAKVQQFGHRDQVVELEFRLVRNQENKMGVFFEGGSDRRRHPSGRTEFVVQNLLEGSDAAAYLLPGDVLLGVNNIKVDGSVMTHRQLVELLAISGPNPVLRVRRHIAPRTSFSPIPPAGQSHLPQQQWPASHQNGWAAPKPLPRSLGLGQSLPSSLAAPPPTGQQVQQPPRGRPAAGGARVVPVRPGPQDAAGVGMTQSWFEFTPSPAAAADTSRTKPLPQASNTPKPPSIQRAGEHTRAFPATGRSTGGGFGVNPATYPPVVERHSISPPAFGGGSFGQQQPPPLPSRVANVEQRACLEAEEYVQATPANCLAASNGSGGSRQQLRSPLEPNTFRIEVHKGVLLLLQSI